MLKNQIVRALVASACALGLWVGSASAQNLDLDEVGAMLVMPIKTSSGDNEITAITVTNAGAAVRLHVNVISGDRKDDWRAQDFTCTMTAHETVLFVFEPDGDRGSKLSYECGGEYHGDVVENSPFDAKEGLFVAVLEDIETGETINSNQIFGDAVVIDFNGSHAFGVGAIPFQGVVPGDGVGDRKYRFDNVEYTRFPSALATNFIAPTSSVEAELILFTLDGTVGQFEVPNAQVSIKFYNDDEFQYSSSYAFDCFAIVDLDKIDERFRAYALGSAAGHMVLTPELVTYPNLAHDAQFDGGEGSVLGVRKPPVHGWLVQQIESGGCWSGDSGPVHAEATLVKKPMGENCLEDDDELAWGRPLAQSNLPIVVHAGDTPVLNAP